ncbi:hypothetical protein GCM10023339_05320 [Alloalcanivorax gelatiniphagus]
MSNDLCDALERAIPGTTAGPALPPADARLASGRRGVRRRRLAASAVALTAAAAVVVPTALSSGPSPEDGQGPHVADGPATPSPLPASPTPTTTEVPDAPTDWDEVPGAFVRSMSTLVRLDGGADVPVVVDRGVTVLDEIEDPFARSEVVAWAGTVRHRGVTYWALTHRSGSGYNSTDTRPIPGRTIEQWVRDHEVAATSALRLWVDLRPDGSLVARDRVTIVGQRSPARPDQAAPGAPSATAMVEVDGARLCLLVRAAGASGDGTDEIALPESEYPGCSDLPGWGYPGAPAS